VYVSITEILLIDELPAAQWLSYKEYAVVVRGD
jgi:hypothetical protein